ncbi:unnamed protein product, partial [Mycena citricolor]
PSQRSGSDESNSEGGQDRERSETHKDQQTIHLTAPAIEETLIVVLRLGDVGAPELVSAGPLALDTLFFCLAFVGLVSTQRFSIHTASP